jgi:DNA-binding transcriptional LysR family regulator
MFGMDTMRFVHVSQLEVFRVVAGLGSVTAAAQTLGYTQSAISRQIGALESELGAKLFDRLPRGVRLTDEGQAALRHVDVIVERLAAVRSDLHALRDLEAGRLRIGAFPTANAALVPNALTRFTAAHPGVTVSLVEGLTPAHLNRLRAGDLDLALATNYPGRPLDDNGIEFAALLDDPLLVAVPRDHWLAGRKRVRLAELAGESWVAGSREVSDTLLAACLRSGFQPRIDFVVAEWMAKLGMVAAGVGITLVSSLAAAAVRADVALVALHKDDTPLRTVYVATQEGIVPPAAVQAFLRMLREAATEYAADHERAGRGPQRARRT